MAKKENVNPAEQYRMERKKRLAQAAKKNSKKSVGGSGKVGKVMQKVISVVLVVAIVAGIGYFVAERSGMLSKLSTAVSIGDTKLSSTEFAFMYYQKYREFSNQASQYEQYYGSNVLGLDSTKSPAEQDSPYKDDNNKTIKWDKYIEDQTVSWINEFIVLYKEALANKYTLSKEDKDDIESQIKEMRSTAAQNNLSLNAYLRLNYASGINEKFFNKYLTMEKIVAKYQEDKQKGFADSHTDEALNAEYNKDKDAYDVVSVRMFTIAKEELEKKEGETDEALKARQEKSNLERKAKAQAVYDATTNVETFLAAAKANAIVEQGATYDADEQTERNRISSDTIKSTINETASKWAFADGRKVGDKAMYETDGGFFVLLMTETQYPAQAVNVRHILVSFKEDTSDTSDPTEEEKKAAKTKADSIYNEWLKGEKTEESFTALVADNSTDTGSKDNGGLYENVTPGQMVRAFDNWCFDRSRKAGDNGIVETNYGYHIMYFSSRSTDYIWRTNMRETLSQDDYSSYLEEALKKDSYKLVKNSKGLAKGTALGISIIETYIEYNNSSNTNTISA